MTTNAPNTSFRDALIAIHGARPANGTNEDWCVVIHGRSFFAYTDGVGSTVWGRHWSTKELAEVGSFVERVFEAWAPHKRMPGCMSGA